MSASFCCEGFVGPPGASGLLPGTHSGVGGSHQEKRSPLDCVTGDQGSKVLAFMPENLGQQRARVNEGRRWLGQARAQQSPESGRVQPPTRGPPGSLSPCGLAGVGRSRPHRPRDVDKSCTVRVGLPGACSSSLSCSEVSLSFLGLFTHLGQHLMLCCERRGNTNTRPFHTGT